MWLRTLFYYGEVFSKAAIVHHISSILFFSTIWNFSTNANVSSERQATDIPTSQQRPVYISFLHIPTFYKESQT